MGDDANRVPDRNAGGPLVGGVAQAEAVTMLLTAFTIFRGWGIDEAQERRLLGEPSHATYQQWKAGNIRSLPADTLRRLDDVLAIHAALRGMFTAPERGHQWVRRPNDAFGGSSALDRMLAGAPGDLEAVRSYLDAERAGW